MEVKPPQTSIGLKAFSQGLANSCRGETGGIHPPLPTWLRTEHTSGQTYRVPNIQWTESLGDHLSRSLFLCSYSLSCWGSLQIRMFKIHHPNIRLQGTANNAVTRSGSASKELTSKTSTEHLSVFTSTSPNPLTITHLATSPTKSNYPKLLLIPQHQRAGVQPQVPQLHGHRCCCYGGQAPPNFHWS